MKKKTRRRVLLIAVILATVTLFGPDLARAYGGPGSVVSGIGALLAVLAAIGAAIFGFLWFPLKKLLKRMRGAAGEEESTVAGASEVARGGD